MNFVRHSFCAERERQERVKHEVKYRGKLYKTGLVISHTDNYCFPSQSVGVLCFSSEIDCDAPSFTSGESKQSPESVQSCSSMLVYMFSLSLSLEETSHPLQCFSLRSRLCWELVCKLVWEMTLHTECCFCHWLILFKILFHLINFTFN